MTITDLQLDIGRDVLGLDARSGRRAPTGSTSDSPTEKRNPRRRTAPTRLTRHSGAPRGGEPGIHEHKPLEYGFRAPSLRSGHGMTITDLQLDIGRDVLGLDA